MKLSVYSNKELLFMSGILSVLVSAVLGLGFIYPAFGRYQLLQTKLEHLRVQAHSQSVQPNERIINFAELLALLKSEPLAQLEVVGSSQSKEGLQLTFRGPFAALVMLIKQLAPSTLVQAQLKKTVDVYEFTVLLKDLRVDTEVQVEPSVKPAGPKIVGSVRRYNHHYCVLEDSNHRIHLSEAVQC